MDKLLVTIVTKITTGEEVCTFSQRPKANPYSQPERCPGQSSLFDFSSEEPARDTQEMVNTEQLYHRLELGGQDILF